jgi:hypothetical protein
MPIGALARRVRCCSYTVRVWYDQASHHMRVDSLDDSTINTRHHEYAVYPRIDRLECSVFKHGGDGPVASGGGGSGGAKGGAPLASVRAETRAL